MELMDGHSNSRHISSEDWSVFNQATYGVTEGVFEWGDGFKLTMQSPNKALLGKGAGLVGGKRVWAKTAETVTIESGTQGMKRVDVVGVEYRADEAGVETAAAKVLKGSPASSGPKPPAVPEGFLPLWRVPLDGINVGTPERAFERIASAKGLRDSVSRLEYDTGWVNVWESDTTHCHARRVGGIVYVRCDVWNGTRPGNDWTQFTTLPDGMKPDRTVYATGSSLTGHWPVNVRIDTSGIISVITEGDITYWTFSASFPAA